MKSFLLAATVAAGLFCSTSSADAQVFFRRSNVYVAPAVSSYPAYNYSAYNYPAYPAYGGVVTSSYYGPYSSGVYSSGYYSPYGGYSTSSYYGGYNGVYGSYYGYRRGRWGW